jgi:hypothetical protein
MPRIRGLDRIRSYSMVSYSILLPKTAKWAHPISIWRRPENKFRQCTLRKWANGPTLIGADLSRS